MLPLLYVLLKLRLTLLRNFITADCILFLYFSIGIRVSPLYITIMMLPLYLVQFHVCPHILSCFIFKRSLDARVCCSKCIYFLFNIYITSKTYITHPVRLHLYSFILFYFFYIHLCTKTKISLWLKIPRGPARST